MLWLLVYIGSLFILMGRNRSDLLIAGIVMVVVAFAIAVYLAVRPHPERPRPRGATWAMAGLAAFYGIAAAVAGVALGWEYAVAALVAGTVPGTALALIIASARTKTRPAEGHLEDVSPEAGDDPFPAIGLDDLTPLGDTPEHSDAEGDPAEARRQRLARARRSATRRRPSPR